MNEILLLQFLHLLCLVYWLGGDLGVFYSSFVVADASNTPETRVKVAKILFALDQAPRICMALILPTGFHLAHSMGLIQSPDYSVGLVWLIGLLWLSMVITLHLKHSDIAWLVKVDYAFRLILIVLLVVFALRSLRGDSWILTHWLPVKLLVFAALITCGLMIRRGLAPFGPAFAQLAQGKVTDEVNQTIRASLARVRPWVVAIWIGLLFNTALGIHLIHI